MKRTGIKICGVTRVKDATLAVELGVDLIGLNFWPRSPRFLTPEVATTIVDAIRGRALSVGLMVDPTQEEVHKLDEALNLDLFQFHGDEDPSRIKWFPERVIQAIRLAPDQESISWVGYDQAWGLLFDCAPAGIYGGTGESWSYERIADLEAPKPVLLAGGLDPGNVADAIVRSNADFVDVCSGVESAPGIKDPDLLARFISEVRDVQKRD